MVKKVFFAVLVAFVFLYAGMNVPVVEAVVLLDSDSGELYIGGEDNEEDSDSEDAKELEEKIDEYEEKISDLQAQEQSLQREIDLADSQIALTELRIQNSIAEIARKEAAIEQLSDDIDDLVLRIDKLEESIEFQEVVLAERLRARYKSRTNSPIVIILGSTTINRLVQKAEYLRVMEMQDKRMIDEMNETKDDYNVQKKIFEEKKSQEEELRAQLTVEKANLEGYRANLEDQRAQKENLLKTTQNDEAKYQELLEEARKELNQILQAVSVLKDQEPTDVDQGDIIGIQGNTGYSFGDHLHFGVYRYSSFEEITGWDWYYNNYVDPAKVLKNKTVYWNTGCEGSGSKSVGKGDWGWPLSSPTVSQGFGHTCYSDAYYGGKPHPAYDMYGPYGSPVYAVEDGEGYFCKNCLGDGANGVFIFHDDDYMTIYWHLQ